MKKIIPFLIFLVAINACKEDMPLTFSEMNFTSEDHAIIEVNIPKFDGDTEASKQINNTIESFVIQSVLSEGEDANSILEASDVFNEAFIQFTKELAEGTQPWEAFVDGEVTYQSSELISVAINTYKNTGGAHGNSIISFLNFDPFTGGLYTYEDIVDHLERLKTLVDKHFKKAMEAESDGEGIIIADVNLPETIGFSEDGMIIVYNQHELEGFSQKLLEFTIPFDEVMEFLVVR